MNIRSHNDDTNKQSVEHTTGQPGQGNGRLSRRILVPTLVIILFLIVGFYIYTFQSVRTENQTRELDESQQAEKIFKSEINRLGDFALGLAIDSASNPEIQKAFAERDRAKLTELTLDSYLALDKAFNIPQYQFHLPPATSFLRLHSLNKFDDDLSSFRHTVVQVNSTKEPVVGLEVGRGGLGLRGIEPVYYKGNHIGSVEFGLNVDQTLVDNLKKEYGNDWRITLTRTALSLATLEDIAALQEGPSPDLLVLASTLEGVFPESDIYSRVLKGNKEIAQVSGAQNRTYSVTVFPLLDYSGVTIGTVEVIFDRTDILRKQSNRLALIVFAGLAAMLLSGFSLMFITNRSLHPLEELTKTAEAIQQGNLNLQVKVTNRDEIGKLAQAFNAMTSQLRELFGQLEQRVEDRTKALSSVAEVSAAASTILDTDILLQQVVDLAKERFGFYHAHIYLLNDTGDTLVLSSGAGEVGRQMVAEGRSIPLDSEQSLVARAAREKKGVTVNDVTTEPNFLPNPLLPDTRSELAVPLMVGDTVLGVFDVQSDEVGRFTESDIAVQTTLASQVASAVQNARLYSETLEAQKLTRNVIDSTDDWIFIKDQNHRYQLVNQGYANSLHIPIADFIGKNDLELGFPEELVKGNPEKGIRGFWADDRAVMDGGVTKQIPDDLVTIDGNIHVFDTAKVPLRDANNKVWGVLAFARDMTERRRLEELMTQRARQQEAINQITQRIQGTTSIEAALQMAVRELGRSVGKEIHVMLDSSVKKDGRDN